MSSDPLEVETSNSLGSQESAPMMGKEVVIQNKDYSGRRLEEKWNEAPLEKIDEVDFERSTLLDLDYESISIKWVNFDYAFLGGCKFGKITAEIVNFPDTHMLGVCFHHSSFNKCVFKGARILGAGEEKASLLLKNKMLNCNFDNCILSNVYIQDCDFGSSQLRKSMVKNCILEEVDFSEVNLKGTMFENCKIKNCIWEEANLADVHFKSCEIDNFRQFDGAKNNHPEDWDLTELNK